MASKSKLHKTKKKPTKADDSPFIGLWLTRSSPHLAYKVIPKAGCTSVGQIMNFIDTGSFFDGNLHHEKSSIWKWGNLKQRKEVIRILHEKPYFCFSLVRNPYSRLLSAFSDKIFGYQENGGRYRGGAIHKDLQKLGLKWGAESNIVSNFKVFLSYVASNIEHRKPSRPDIHWTPQHRMLQANAKRNPDFRFHYVGHIETFRADMEAVIRGAGINHQNLPVNIPRENSTSITKIPISEFFGSDEVAIMLRIFAADFEFLGYSKDPSHLKPLNVIDLEKLNRSLHESISSSSENQLIEQL